MTSRLSFLVPLIVLAGACASTTTQQSGDAGTDAGAIDAGTDAGAIDAGTTDAGSIDARTDAGTIDGRILFRGLGEGIAFDVVMYRAAVAAPATITRGDGHCDIHPVGDGDGFATMFPTGDLDLGATVTATSGSTSFSAAVDSNGGFQYVFSQAGVDAFAKTWTLTNSGSSAGLAATTLATAQVPAAVVPIVPEPMGGSVDTTSGHVTLKWSGGEGAQTFHINILATKAEVDCYPAPTATSFDLPADVVKVLDPQVTPALWAESVTTVQVGERRLWVRVTSDNLD